MKLKLLAFAALSATAVTAFAQTTYVVPNGPVVQPAPSQVVIPAAPGGPASTSVAPAAPVYSAPVVAAPAPSAPVVAAPPAPVTAYPNAQVVYPTNAVAVVGTPITVTQKPSESGPGSI